jgi:hypothetical protein
VSRTISLSVVITALLMAAAGPNAHGQDASPPAAASANQSSPAAQAKGAGQAKQGDGSRAAGGQTDSAAQGGGGPAADQAQAGGPAQGGANGADKASGHGKPVCFNLTGRCVEPAKSSTHRGAGASGTRPTGSSSGGKSLDLAAPDVRTVVSADELKEPLPNGEQIKEVQESETVAVKSESPGPDVPLGFGAIWWAVNHPANAWKIFLPAGE